MELVNGARLVYEIESGFAGDFREPLGRGGLIRAGRAPSPSHSLRITVGAGHAKQYGGKEAGGREQSRVRPHANQIGAQVFVRLSHRQVAWALQDCLSSNCEQSTGWQAGSTPSR